MLCTPTNPPIGTLATGKFQPHRRAHIQPSQGVAGVIASGINPGHIGAAGTTGSGTTSATNMGWPALD